MGITWQSMFTSGSKSNQHNGNNSRTKLDAMRSNSGSSSKTDGTGKPDKPKLSFWGRIKTCLNCSQVPVTLMSVGTVLLYGAAGVAVAGVATACPFLVGAAAGLTIGAGICIVSGIVLECLRCYASKRADQQQQQAQTKQTKC